MTPQELVTKGFSPELAVFFTSMLPIIELRGALPLAINLFHFHWSKAFILSFSGNLLPIPFILFLLQPAVRFLQRIKLFASFFNWLFTRTKKKGKIVERYQEIGLAIFVAIPLPATGAWTGAILAALLGMKFKKSLFAIAVGVFIAGVIVTTLCLLGWLGAVIAGAALIILAAFGLWRF